MLLAVGAWAQQISEQQARDRALQFLPQPPRKGAPDAPRRPQTLRITLDMTAFARRMPDQFGSFLT